MCSGRAFLHLILLVHGALGANILGICPYPAVSHQLPFHNIMKLLLNQGHHVTVISPIRIEEPSENFTFVDISFTVPIYRRSFNYSDKNDLRSAAIKLLDLSLDACDEGLKSAAVRNVIKQNRRFDLVIVQIMMHNCYLGVVHQLGMPPVIGYSSFAGYSAVLTEFGNTVNPAVNSDFLTPYTNRMTFWQRLHNWWYVQMSYALLWKRKICDQQTEIVRRHFGESVPSIQQLFKNITAIFMNTYWGIEYPWQTYPNVIETSAIHINDSAGELPEELQEFMDGAKEGVVYMSFGSSIQINLLPESTIREIIQSFSTLRQKVVWKFESQSKVKMPSNVYVRSWLPQQAVLAHPNVRVFITQGGWQSFQEAVYHAVPVIVIPLFTDQFRTAWKAEFAGLGRHLPFEDLTSRTLSATLKDLLDNSTYQARMQVHKSKLRAHRQKSVDDILWWTEFILKHGSIPELRPPTLYLEWYQIHLLDIFGLLLLGLSTVLFIVYCAFKRVIKKSVIKEKCN